MSQRYTDPLVTKTNPTLWLSRLPRVLLFLGAAICLLVSSGEAFEHRRGTPSVGAQGMYGILEGDSAWRDTFSEGLGMNFSFRFNFARDKAYGFTFEQQHFNRVRGLDKTGGPGEYLETDADDLELQILMADFYKYFERPKRRSFYVMASAGIYRPQLLYRFTDETGIEADQASFPGENLIGRIGAGMEYFVTRKFSIDVRLSGYYIRGSKESMNGTSVSGQGCIGFHLYVTQ